MFSVELCSFFNFSGCGGSSLEKKENQDNNLYEKTKEEKPFLIKKQKTSRKLGIRRELTQPDKGHLLKIYS